LLEPGNGGGNIHRKGAYVGICVEGAHSLVKKRASQFQKVTREGAEGFRTRPKLGVGGDCGPSLLGDMESL